VKVIGWLIGAMTLVGAIMLTRHLVDVGERDVVSIVPDPAPQSSLHAAPVAMDPPAAPVVPDFKAVEPAPEPTRPGPFARRATGVLERAPPAYGAAAPLTSGQDVHGYRSDRGHDLSD
jgi:hypothetical protein